MLTLGEQLVLLALDAGKGRLRKAKILPYGLNAAALAELLHRGLVTLRRPDGAWGVTPVADGRPLVGDPVLEVVWKRLEAVTAGGRRQHPDDWVQAWTEPTMPFYLRTLKQRGVLDWDKPTDPRERFGRFRLLDAEALSGARGVVERVRIGAKPDLRDRDLAGIVARLGLGEAVYPGLWGRGKRADLLRSTETQRFAVILGRVLPKKDDPYDFSGYGGTDYSAYTNGGD